MFRPRLTLAAVALALFAAPAAAQEAPRDGGRVEIVGEQCEHVALASRELGERGGGRRGGTGGTCDETTCRRRAFSWVIKTAP